MLMPPKLSGHVMQSPKDCFCPSYSMFCSGTCLYSTSSGISTLGDGGLVGGKGGSSGGVRAHSCGDGRAGNGAIGGVDSGADSEAVDRYAGDSPSSRSSSSLNF